MLELQKYLRNNDNKTIIEKLDSLEKKYHIKAKQHRRYDNLYLFKYSQIKSNFDLKIVCESRGLILDSSENWEVVSLPYYKFFNYGESNAIKLSGASGIISDEEFNICNSKIYEKLDGSLMTLYYYDDKWNVSTSGNADGSGEVSGYYKNSNKKITTTFEELFWDIWKKQGYMTPSDKTLCYMFELISPLNQIVVSYKKEDIILHGARSVDTLQEFDPLIIGSLYNWKIVKTINFSDYNNNIDTLKKECNLLSPIDDLAEGYVICDNNFNRLKIKSQKYIDFSYISGKLTKGNTKLNLITVIQKNEGEEVLSTFPQYKNTYDELLISYNKLLEEIKNEYDIVTENNMSRKEIAMKLKGKMYMSCIYYMIDNIINEPYEWLMKQDNKKILSHFEKNNY